jgi:mRNA interferase RelE/StbE
VLKNLKKMDKSDAKKILDYLREISELDNPFSRGHGLTENKKGLWRYRVKGWRILCEIKESALIIHVVTIGPRNTIYTDP